MMKTRKSIAVILVALTLTLSSLIGCGTGQAKIKAENLAKSYNAMNPTTVTVDKNFATKLGAFYTALYQATAKDGKNTLICPFSVDATLSMIANGAQGQTLTEMEKVLFGDGTVEEFNKYFYSYSNSLTETTDLTLHVANSIWIKDDESLHVNDGFLQTNADYYRSDVYKSAFDDDTLKDINNWAKNNTDGEITEILDQIDKDAIMYLMNAVLFDAKWANKYEKSNVIDGTFHGSKGDEKVKMLVSSEPYYFENDFCTGFMKDYEGNRFAFCALLPNQNIPLDTFVKKLGPTELYHLLSEPLRCGGASVTMPEFEVDYEETLTDILIEMGMPTAFDAQKADFSRLGYYDDANIYLSFVKHKTTITVNANGTKASAITIGGMNKATSAPSKSVVLDRPFAYFIMDKTTSLPLFMGIEYDV